MYYIIIKNILGGYCVMKNVYLIIAEADMRKSTTIRSLTGRCTLGVHQIAHTNGNINNTHVNISSLQESGICEQAFIKLINNSYNNIDLLIPLRLNSFKNLPDAFSYINAFQAAGWNIVFVEFFLPITNTNAVTSQQIINQRITPLPQSILPSLPHHASINFQQDIIYGTDLIPSNAVAKFVRDDFQWL